jgi:histone acetyltransferase (RNA polymerase elongator complex component)
VHQRLREQGTRCRCIRCREVGHRIIDEGRLDTDKIKILTTKYVASEGEEIFISAEDTENDTLIGYLRLRVPSEKAHSREDLEGRTTPYADAAIRRTSGDEPPPRYPPSQLDESIRGEVGPWTHPACSS